LTRAARFRPSWQTSLGPCRRNRRLHQRSALSTTGEEELRS
jgi:hypothetical protein